MFVALEQLPKICRRYPREEEIFLLHFCHIFIKLNGRSHLV